MGYSRMSAGIKNTGVSMTLIGLFGAISPNLVPVQPGQQEAVGQCTGIGLIVLLIGLICLFLYYGTYKVSSGYALVTRDGKAELDGWHFGLPPRSSRTIQHARKNLDIPGGDRLIELETPDNGVIGAFVAISYSPNLDNPTSLTKFDDTTSISTAVTNRVRGALSSWSMGKPVPGTVKRALAMQSDAEIYLIGKLTGTSNQLVLHDDPTLYFDSGFPVGDLGIRIHEINITKWTPLRSGSGKADWGDGDHVGFDAQAIFKQFHAHTDSLSNLRKLKEALLEKYPEEIDDIEDIYDQVRISMKENRDR